jgi:preprotein translocase subunit YajC
VWIAYAAPGEVPSSSGGATAASGGFMGLLIWLLIIGGMFYFLLILPQRRRDKEFKRMISSLKRGDTVITIGGIVGKVIDIKNDTVKIKVANTTELEITKRAIGSVIGKKETDNESSVQEKK